MSDACAMDEATWTCGVTAEQPSFSTVAILGQGTNRAVATSQAFFAPGSGRHCDSRRRCVQATKEGRESGLARSVKSTVGHTE